MSTATGNKGFISAGMLAAIASSLCCIGPVIAFFAGISGAASAFSWIEPARPYLMGASAIALGLAFWQAYKPVVTDDCGCEATQKRSFLRSKGFLWGITLFAIGMFAFPYYAHIFYPGSQGLVDVVDENDLQHATLYIDGMTCSGCEEHVTLALTQEEGVVDAAASYEQGLARVSFDGSKRSIDQLALAVETSSGYTVTRTELTK